MVWQQASSLALLASYQPSRENLVVNGDFSLDVRLGDDPDSFNANLQGDIAAGRTVDIHVNGGGESDLITVDGQSPGFDDPGSAIQSFDLGDDGEVGDNLASSADAARRYDSHESRL